jgi:hypothetical protein
MMTVPATIPERRAGIVIVEAENPRDDEREARLDEVHGARGDALVGDEDAAGTVRQHGLG